MKRRVKNGYLAAMSQRMDERGRRPVGRWREDREIQYALRDCHEGVARELREVARCLDGLDAAHVDTPEVAVLWAALSMLKELEIRRDSLLWIQRPMERDLWFRRGWTKAERRRAAR